METTLWILQIFLALVFLYSGINKAIQTKETLIRIKQTGVADLSYPFIRFIAVTEILGSIGITIPELTGIATILTPIVALCFVFVMVCAIPIHWKRREFKSVALNITILILSGFVAYGRWYN